MKVAKSTILVSAVVPMSAMCSVALAGPILNGDFEAGLAGWTVIGATAGTAATGFELARDPFGPDGTGSWTPPAPPSTLFASLWSTDFTGATATFMDSTPFTAGAGDIVSFDWFFDDGAPIHGGPGVDTVFSAFAVKLGGGGLAPILTALSPGADIPWSSASVALPSAGTWFVHFEIFQSALVLGGFGPGPFESLLGVDNVKSTVAPIPLPSGALLALGGLGVVGGIRRRPQA
jgi:hypothetical protein